VMLIVSALIKCVSRGPVFFRQERVGHQGRRFICLKFRTMKLNADTEAHRQHLADLMSSNEPMVKLDTKGDARLIAFGPVLRATGLDELPQLINVLRGEMSLVGPRPCLPYEYDRYENRQKRRFNAVPGLTGLWQVSGKNKTTFAEMINLDTFYAENSSVWLDMAIILRTPLALVRQVVDSRRGTQVKGTEVNHERRATAHRDGTPPVARSSTTGRRTQELLGAR
jgi:lipopolysaccharide/colanic/teichoic acid biosynthesis glycosyltransferase